MIRRNGLSLFFLVVFVLALAGQSFAGLGAYNDDQLGSGGYPVSWGAYVTSADFVVDVAENWQSEYLQFLLFIVVTVWLVQRGSPESKAENSGDQVGPGSPRWARAGGLRNMLFANSLGLVMGVAFILSWYAQSVAGTAAYNRGQLSRLQDPVTWPEYVASPDFWDRTLQNWQSEFLAVASMVLLAIFLRERGSPQSKKVGDPHAETASSG